MYIHFYSYFNNLITYCLTGRQTNHLTIDTIRHANRLTLRIKSYQCQ